MNFTGWTRALSHRGLRVVPPSHPVPVVVWALRAGGGALHFRCRGTSVTLAEYDDAAVTLAESASICGCGCGVTAQAPQAPPRLTVGSGARPAHLVRFDGAESKGWTGHEAGLLSVPTAAALFDRLLTELESARSARAT